MGSPLIEMIGERALPRYGIQGSKSSNFRSNTRLKGDQIVTSSLTGSRIFVILAGMKRPVDVLLNGARYTGQAACQS